MTTPSAARLSHFACTRSSLPSSAASMSSMKSDCSRIITGWVSGSPKRQLYSRTLGGPSPGGLDHGGHDAGVDFGRHHRSGRIRAHAAGVGAGVAVAGAFVVLRGGERQGVFTRGPDHKAG